MAAMDPVGNEKQGRTSSVFSTLLDDFETTPGIVLHFIESTNWNYNWIINRKLQVSKLKNFIHFIRNSNIEYNYSRESSKIIENPIRTDIKTSPLHSYETCSFLERIESRHSSRNRFFHGRPKANSAQDVKMSLGVTTISSTPRRVAISRRYELLILAT